MKLLTLARYLSQSNSEAHSQLFYQFCQLREVNFLDSLERYPQLKEIWSSISSDFIKEIERESESDLHLGIRTCLPQDVDYPSSFFNLDKPVWCFQYLGQPIWKEREGLAVVGSREPSYDSLLWMEEVLPPVLRELKLPVVSGGARGVDQKAHSLSLRSGQSTILALPSGLRALYPKSLEPWCEYVLGQGGGLISEYRSQTPMHKAHFISRNRLIPSLSLATLIVEARVKSGTLITAKYSIDQGKPLFVMPTHPLDSRGRGGLNLITEGATPVRDALDLIHYLQSELRIPWVGVQDSPDPYLSTKET